MKTGFIFPTINKILYSINKINLVELFKFIGVKIVSKKGGLEEKIIASRFAVDAFIVTKWILLIVLWIIKVSNGLWVFIIWYLIVMNAYTYFFYHIWSTEILDDHYFDIERIKRRFLNLLLAITYTIFGFAYLYNCPYSSNFQWAYGEPNFFQSLWYSLANSLTANYDQVKPTTSLGYSVSMVQLVIVFIFITIIIGCSIPQIKTSKKEEK